MANLLLQGKNKIITLAITLALAGVFYFFKYFSQEGKIKEPAFVTKGPLPQLPDSSSGNRKDINSEGSESQDLENLKDERLPMGASSFSGPRALTDKEMDDMDAQFEKFEKGWDERMEKLFLNELSLDKVDFEDYQVMRKGYEEDRLEAFEEFHMKMAKEKGIHYSYSPTEEMLHFEGKLKKEYLDTFRRRFGEEAFTKYFNALEEYNSFMRQKMDPKIGVLNIDF